MEWCYKNVIISIENDGKFYFEINKKLKIVDSLVDAKEEIDLIYKDYYNFNHFNLTEMCKKLNKKETDFVISLIKELKNHESNAYCEIGISDDFLFDISEIKISQL